MSTDIRPLPPLNDNYTPPQPWRCSTHAAHDCTGNVIGAVGAYPVCVTGAEAEIEARAQQAERVAALMATPEMQAEIRREQEWERRYS